MTDFETWVHDYEGRVYRYWVYKRMFTPLEVEKKYTDETYYEDNECEFGMIYEAIELPDGDILIGFIDPDNEGTTVEGMIEYYKLSELRFQCLPCDQLRRDD